MLKRSDIVNILVLGEIVGASFFAIFRVQCADPEFQFFVCGLPQAVAAPLFFLGVPLAALGSLVGAWFLSKKMPSFFQVGKFIAVGVSNTAIDWGILNLLVFPLAFTVLGVTDVKNIPQLYRVTMKGVSFTIATLNSFFWNKTWTFQHRSTAGIGREAAQFYFFTAIGLSINVGAFWAFQKLGPQDNRFWVGVLAPGFATILSAIWDFFAYRFIVFKPKKQEVEVA